jgi:cytochrome c553
MEGLDMWPKRCPIIGIRQFANLAVVVGGLALFSPQARAQDAVDLLKELDQGWSGEQTAAWYSASQGSRLIPLAWLRSLEQPGATALFLEPEYIASFGYLPRATTASGALPVGFVVDTGPDGELSRTRLRWKADQGENERWVGLTCSACHTSQLTYKGKTLRIEGGPSITNFQVFINSLNSALVETANTPEKLDRFVSRVLPGKLGSTKNKADLKAAFDQLVAWQLLESKVNATQSIAYGPGRIDAFGHIYNKVALLLGGTTTRGNPSDAPVSIPFLWRAPQLDKVQYNGIAPKTMLPTGVLDVGALGRNTGEVIGVFGDVIAHKDPGVTNGFVSSVKVKNLIRLEDVLASLRPPVWPASIFGKPASANGVVDQAKLARGKELYSQNCASCHELVDRKNLTKIIEAQMNLFNGPDKDPVTGKKLHAPGTDPGMACNAYDYSALSGPLANFKHVLITNGQTIANPNGLGELLRVTVVATLLDQKVALATETAARLVGIKRLPTIEESESQLTESAAPDKKERLQRCLTQTHPNLGYTSRPLNGVWATAPFLHNGSVPTIYDLLLPPSQRPKSFFLGTREYDPSKLGFITDKNDVIGNTFEFKTRDDAGNVIDGNSNAGHDYSNDKFNDDDRFAIIAYLKTL